MITIAKTPVTRRDDEFAPMVSAETRRLLRGVHPAATALYLEVQSLPDGFNPADEFLLRRLGWAPKMLRKAKTALIEAGLYVVERIRDAAGRWSTFCRYVTNRYGTRSGPSPQVKPSDPLPAAGQGSHIPPTTDKKREGGTLRPHDPTTCYRNASNLPCRQCAEQYEDRKRVASSPTSVPPSAADLLAAIMAKRAAETECDHGYVLAGPVRSKCPFGCTGDAT